MRKETVKSGFVVFSSVLLLLTFVMATFLTLFVASILMTIGVFAYSENKTAKWTILLVSISFNVLTSATFGVPIRHSFPMSGFVRDKVDGVPVEGAIFECRWVGMSDVLIGSHAGFDIDKSYAVTDKDGKYFLKGRWTFDLFFPTVTRYVTLRHPLYETLSDINLKWDMLREGRNIGPQGGVITYNIELEKLEDKYRDKRKVGGKDVSWEFNEMISYSRHAKMLALPVKWESIFKKWDEILVPYGGDRSTTKSEIVKAFVQGE